MLPGKRYTGPILDRPSPSLLLAFAMDGSLDSRVTFTRADSGTRFDYSGVMQTESSNVARFTHDPATYYPSSTSNSISRGKKTFAVSYQYTVGAIVQATYDASNWMRGTVIAASGSSVTIRVEKTVGSGTYAAWNLIQSLGLLIEESRTNLLTYSEEFDNAAWAKAGATVTANTVVAPDGTLTGDKFVEGMASATPLAYESYSFTSGTTYTLSLFAKDAGRRYLGVWGGTAFGNGITFFDLQTGTIAYTSGAVGSSITFVGNGWYRITVTDTAPISASSNVGFQLSNDGTNSSYTGDGTSGIYIWGAQLEAGSFPTSYIKTTSSTVTRAAGSASMTGADFSDWYNVPAGTFILDVVARSGDTILTCGGTTITADYTGRKKYAVSYSSDQSASSLVLGDGEFLSVAYYPSALSSAWQSYLTS